MQTARATIVNRPAVPRLAAAAGPAHVTTPTVQRVAGPAASRGGMAGGVRVSSPHDPAEREADAVAREVMRTPASAALATARPTPLAGRHAGPALLLQRRATDGPDVGANVAADLQRALPAGEPLPVGVRRFMEPRFGADFSGVRVHVDERAARLARGVHARAFAYGQHLFFGRDAWRPEASEGRELIAHELTHTIQQGAVRQARAGPASVLTAPAAPRVQRRALSSGAMPGVVAPSTGTGAVRAGVVAAPALAPPAVRVRAEPHVQRLGISDVLDFFADAAYAIPGYRMFTIVLGVNPINMSRVERSGANVLRAAVEFIPGGTAIVRVLDQYGVFERAGAWVEEQVRTLGMSGAVVRAALDRFLDSLGWRDVFSPGDVWRRAQRIFTEPVDRLLAFARGLVTGILQIVRDAVLRPIAGLAARTRGYDLLKAILGRDPITRDPYPRNADTLIGGFMTLIGQQEVWENIKRANAVTRAWTWFEGALAELLAFARGIPDTFLAALRSLELIDFLVLPRAFARIGGAFLEVAGRFVRWAGAQVLSLLQIIFEVVAPGAMPYLRRLGGAVAQIFRNPIGFVRVLVQAALTGFRQFASRFLVHLRAALVQWLTGTLGGVVYIPRSFSLGEIVRFVVSVLGLTWQSIRGRLVRVLGERVVGTLERGFDLLMVIVREGPAGALQQLLQHLQGVPGMVMEQVMTFVRERIVVAAVTRLLSMLNPAGAFVQAIIAIYNTVRFFVERLRQITDVATAFFDSLASIAGGAIAGAANRIETTLAGMLTLVISFLARLAGLGSVGEAVLGIVRRAQAAVERALDRVVEWIVAQARRVGRLGGRPTGSVEAHTDAEARKQAVLHEVRHALQRGIRRSELVALIERLRRRYNVRRAEVTAGARIIVENSAPETIEGFLAFSPDDVAESHQHNFRLPGGPGGGDIHLGDYQAEAVEAETVKGALGPYLSSPAWPNPHGAMPLSAPRPTRVRANLLGRLDIRMSRVPRDNQTTRMVGHMGDFERAFRRGNWSSGAYFQGGHVIGHQFGGPETFENLVPMMRELNLSLYAGVEQFLNDALPRVAVGTETGALPVALQLDVHMRYGSSQMETVSRLVSIIGSKFGPDTAGLTNFEAAVSRESFRSRVSFASRVPTQIAVVATLRRAPDPTTAIPQAATASTGTGPGSMTATRTDPFVVATLAAVQGRRRPRPGPGGGRREWQGRWSFTQSNA